MEAWKAGRYQIVDRWSPPTGDRLRALEMMLMIDLAHFALHHQDVY